MLWLAFLCYFFCAFRCQHRSESPSSYHRSTHTRSSQTLNLCTFQGTETNKNLALFLLTFSFKNLPSMAKTRPGVDSYTIKGTNKVVRAGEYCVLMRPSDAGKPPYVVRVEKIEADARNNVKVHCRWYYRPEESLGGRRQFHGAKELFLSDHFDVQSAHTTVGKCIVHTFKSYTRLENVGAEDYYCRFEYKAATGAFTPDRVAVYCKCEMPYNPDDLMVQCEGCKDWYHPACVAMTIDEAKQLDHFVKKSQNGFTASPADDVKVVKSSYLR